MNRKRKNNLLVMSYLMCVLLIVGLTGCKNNTAAENLQQTVDEQGESDNLDNQGSNSDTDTKDSKKNDIDTGKDADNNRDNDTEKPDRQEMPVKEDKLPEFTVSDMTAVKYAVQTVNVRSGASKEYEKVGLLAAGDVVEVTGLSDTGWYRITIDGKTGYVAGSYLTDEAPVPENAANEQTSVSPDAATDENSSDGTTTDNGMAGDYATQILDKVNEERAAAGLPALTLSSTLSAAAQQRAVEVQTVFDHVRPDGSSCFTVFGEYGLNYSWAGENIAWGQTSVDSVMSDWMNSEGHKANILGANFTQLGVGVYEVNGRKSWVQLFMS